MIFARSLGGPQAAAEERTLNWEEVQQLFRTAFLTGTEVENSVPSAERLSPVAAAHRILTNSFGLIPFGLYRRDGEERVPVEDPALNQVIVGFRLGCAADTGAGVGAIAIIFPAGIAVMFRAAVLAAQRARRRVRVAVGVCVSPKDRQ